MEACRLSMSKLIWAEAKDLRLKMSPMLLKFAPHLWMSSSFLNSSPSLKLWVILLWSSRYLKTNSSTFLASPEKVGSVVEVRHPGCLRHHLLEQLPAGSRHLSLLQKEILFANFIFFPWFFLPWVIERSDTFDINYMRLGAQETEFQTINYWRWWCWETVPSRSWRRCPLFRPCAIPWCWLIY